VERKATSSIKVRRVSEFVSIVTTARPAGRITTFAEQGAPPA